MVCFAQSSTQNLHLHWLTYASSPPRAKDGEPETTHSWVNSSLMMIGSLSSPTSYRVHGLGDGPSVGKNGRQSIGISMGQ